MSGRAQNRAAIGDDRGFIVIVVLWMLAALATLALIYLTYVTNTAVTVAVNTDRLQADALMNAGLELTAYRLTAQSEAARPTSGTFNARVGAGRIAVTFRSEAARIDLNAAPKAMLIGLMTTGLGVSAADAPDYADRILAWRSSTEPGQDNPEDSYYRTLGASYLPRHAPFQHADELWLVRGIPPNVIERMLPFVTVFSNMRTVNVLDAAPQVVAALPGMTPETLQRLLRDRADPGVDPQSLVGLAGSASATIEGAKAYRVTVAAEAPSHRQSSAEIVILLLESGDEPYRVLSWHNAFDGSAGKPL
ncbi:general secretion pathway protein GspK [Bradyrhizobium guangzhouense]|uniref:general secretion pathway protein GspK n=1 Tax=Bradyrhizobium guangzhouense TaxID=1325095 RepID=UPI001009D425|nr:type II secretion system protein GspK [Bradyrhizobium guangzhouense]RXH19431.1 type II secretory protein PulK [Bradyrhizobium guangzhouense]